MEKFLLLLTFVTSTYGVGLETCNYNDQSTCLDNWPCVWCNQSSATNMTGCYKIPVCGVNKEIYNSCNIDNREIYHLTCLVSSTLFIVLLIMGYYISMILIFGKVNKILISEEVSDKVRKSINTVIAIMTVVPLLLTFIFNPVTFYFLFCSYLITACMVYLCVNPKKVIESETERPPSYTEQGHSVQPSTPIQATSIQATPVQPIETRPLL